MEHPDLDRWFREEVHVHDRQLKAWLSSQFPAMKHDVEDVAQDSYLKVWQRQAAKPIASVKAFLFRAARNAAIDLLRRNRRSHVDPRGSLAAPYVIDQTPDPAVQLSRQEKFNLLAEAVGSLSERRYQVIVLHKFQGLSQAEVARTLGIHEHSVANHVARAVRHCEEYLAARGVRSLSD